MPPRAGASRQQGQAIVIVALILVVLFGFLGLAIDGGRGYVDRRGLQAAVDGGALAAAYNYMNTTDYTAAEQAATNVFASNVHIYSTSTCSGYGSTSVSCSFNDPSAATLTITVVNKAIAGVSFTLVGSNSEAVTIMQVLGAGPTIPVAAMATAVARRNSTTAASIQTLAPNGCGGTGGFSLRITGTESTTIIGDVWANGTITSNGAATATVTGNVVDICPSIPPPLGGFTVSGSEVNGWALPDPDYPLPSLNATAQTWNQQNYTVVHFPGTYGVDPKLGGGAGCFFLDGGVYDWQAGLTLNGGLVSNELRPPDEPSLVATTGALSGPITSIPVQALTSNVSGGSTVTVAGQAFTVTSAGAAVGATSIPVTSQAVSGTVAAGTTVVTMARAANQFWDINGVGCSGSFQPYPNSAGSGNPAIPAATYGIEVTALRWSPNGVSSCSGPTSSSCFMRESAPSMCRLVDIGGSQFLKVWVSNVPGAMDYNVYVSNGSCAGPFGYLGQINNNVTEGNHTVSACAPALTRNQTPPSSFNYCDLGSSSGSFNDNNWAPDYTTVPPDPEGPPPGPPPLPNSDAGPATAAPPAGDWANENQCVNSTGSRVACPIRITAGYITPGAVELFFPGCGTTSTCCSAAISMAGGGDVYLFSGQQFGRILLYEPGPEQTPPPNSCANSVDGHGVTSFLGIFYLPAASITITGSSGYVASIAGGLIAYTATINGNGSVSIVGDPSLRTWPPGVHLTQ